MGFLVMRFYLVVKFYAIALELDDRYAIRSSIHGSGHRCKINNLIQWSIKLNFICVKVILHMYYTINDDKVTCAFLYP